MKLHHKGATALAALALALAPLIGASGALAPSAGAAPLTHVLTCERKLATQPKGYVIACADANTQWLGVTWSTWKATYATGHGVLDENDCAPNCAAGTFIKYTGTWTLSQVVSTKQYGRLFSRAVFGYSVKGKAKAQSFELFD